jgi:Rieske Fe-S protein
VGLVLAPIAYAALGRWMSSPGAERIQEQELGTADVLPPGTSREVLMGREKVVVGRSKDGAMHAVSGMCTHMGCSIRFDASGTGEFACNCHESRFDLDGVNLSGPAQAPLKRYGVEVRDGKTWLLNPLDAEGS